MCIAVPGKVLEISGDDPLLQMGLVNFGGTIKQVSLALVPGVKSGNYVYVHVGIAISIIDEAEANEVMGFIRTIVGNDRQESDPV